MSTSVPPRDRSLSLPASRLPHRPSILAYSSLGSTSPATFCVRLPEMFIHSAIRAVTLKFGLTSLIPVKPRMLVSNPLRIRVDGQRHSWRSGCRPFLPRNGLLLSGSPVARRHAEEGIDATVGAEVPARACPSGISASQSDRVRESPSPEPGRRLPASISFLATSVRHGEFLPEARAAAPAPSGHRGAATPEPAPLTMRPSCRR